VGLQIGTTVIQVFTCCTRYLPIRERAAKHSGTCSSFCIILQCQKESISGVVLPWLGISTEVSGGFSKPLLQSDTSKYFRNGNHTCHILQVVVDDLAGKIGAQGNHCQDFTRQSRYLLPVIKRSMIGFSPDHEQGGREDRADSHAKTSKWSQVLIASLFKMRKHIVLVR